MRITHAAATNYGKERVEVSLDTWDLEAYFEERIPGIVLKRDVTHAEKKSVLTILTGRELYDQAKLRDTYLAESIAYSAGGRLATLLATDLDDVLETIVKRLAGEGFVGIELVGSDDWTCPWTQAKPKKATKKAESLASLKSLLDESLADLLKD